MQADYIILGQGIAGTLLGYQLVKEGKKVICIDAPVGQTSSRVASGLINPVTGKRIVKTWLIDTLLPAAIDTYREIEQAFGMSILKQCNVLDFFETREQQGIFTERIAEEPEHLQLTDEQYWKPWFNYNFGVGEIRPCWLVDVHALLDKWRQELTQSNSLIEEQFDWKDCEVSDGRVSYKGVTARAIICCEGVAAADNPYFSLLPYSINKGEAIIATIRGLPTNNIYKQGLKIVPGKNDLFWIGASFEWKYESKQPTETFRKKVEQHLQYRLKLPYNIMEHIAAERPSTVDYKPFVGMHPAHPAVGIFNGLGTKGCSLAPYFAAQLSQHLLDGSAIMPDVDVQRFARILSR